MGPQRGDGVLMDATAEQIDAQGISPQEFVRYAVSSRNLAEDMADGQLTRIATQVMSDYDADKASMSDWFESMERGLELARLVKSAKDYPFPGAANIKYPLITSAALQFNARAYPAIVPADRPVLAKVWGDDPQGLKAARAERVSEFQSWQLASQVSEWEEETDKLLVQLPIVGTMVRKWWYDPVEARPRCRTVQPGRFIVNDHVKVLSEAPRCTEELSLYPIEIEERKRAGTFVSDFDPQTSDADKQAPEEFIEQHTRLDLDEDGYPEPYIVTVHCDSSKVVRIVADFREADVRFNSERRAVPVQRMVPQVIQTPVGMQEVQRPVMAVEEREFITGIASVRRGSYFVAHQFFPSMDGGFWGTGLGVLLGDISESINSIINMLIDAGHYASLGGGFIGSEFRLRGGAQRLRPGEYKQVTEGGNDIRNAIVPVNFQGPDATLFQLLGLLIDAGREIASVKDIMTGDAPRQNQTATATLALIEQGMMVFTAAYKRIFRACKEEYRMLANINAETVTPEQYQAFHDQAGTSAMAMAAAQGQPMQPGQQVPQMPEPLDPRRDFDLSDMDIQPVADPRSVTKMQQAAKAQLVMQMAQDGLVDQAEATARIVEAMDLGDVDSLMPKPNPMAEQMAQMQVQAAQADLVEKAAKIELTLAQVEETRAQAMENMANATSEQIRAANEVRKTSMEGLKALLDDERARIGEILRAAQGMAGAPRNGNAAQGFGAGIAASERPAGPQLPLGQAGTGILPGSGLDG